ncbi:MAG: flagellar biosynthesis anti-sigma factor FlgM [Bryobacteraceae bacterium]|jgi:anti-sigma28 factor (negative regulator of flagellin synthesis)
MKVVDRNLNSGSPVESGRTQETQRASTTAGGATAAQAGGGDQVEFSNTLGSLARALSTFNADHASKVQALAAQYQSGTYRANSLATSQSMVSHALTTGVE